ncbi:hypothetical protein TVAG_093470 [Trichomonas vaginalis G3]|uniref:Uncharacterized protein n=1 Tax=Trichomonas vaginalis (strain ATCC PRA-98 / G3) TaxID=412133 RepID=A2DBH0_TRIV3|nr:hypothetical protein TVAGG3_0382320 [Trichomonas vaginalis G3]EAY22173.1 hypothetical protein TVAG_093470 [Trichomonas vaginalis G3]KAI5533369.1 hypothetical protein TVAGG3_0382320 [Trichomonas vaginalis G3]|eukprot:XP_001583159.1 hypothetical protein [Trichomonas vaginalis G3]
MNMFNFVPQVEQPSFMFPPNSEYNRASYDKYHSYVDYNKSQITQYNIDQFLELCKQNPLNAYLGMLTVAPEHDPRFAISLLEIALKLDLPDKAKSGLALRFVDAIIMSKGVTNDTFVLMEQYAKEKPEIFGVALLALHAKNQKPIEDLPIKFAKSSRVSSLIYFYHAINLLLLDKFIEAEENLRHALSLSNYAKDAVPHFYQYLALTMFINHKSYALFQKSVSLKYPISEDIKNLWDLDKVYMTPAIYRHWQKFVLEERARRIIIDAGTVFTTINYADLEKKCANLPKDDFSNLFKRVAADINARVEGGKVIFSLPHMTSQIEDEIRIVQTKLAKVQAAQ